jgi:hypothetical protein
MQKITIIEMNRELFDKLLSEKSLNKQRGIAKEISNYSGQVNKYKKKYPELEEIQESCLVMEHWKDDSGFCKLTKKDIKLFLEKLKPKNLIIASRRNSEDGFYLKFKASDDAIITLNILIHELGDTFLDMEIPERKFEFSKWKDDCIRVKFKGSIIELVFGNKYIHMFVRGNKNHEEINKIIKRYSEWIKI